MSAIVLAPAAATVWDEEDRLQGSRSLPLSPRGREEALRLAREIPQAPVAAIYAGHSRHCLETARIVAHGRPVPVRCLDELAEVNHGLWEGVRRAQLHERYPLAYATWLRSPTAVCPPQGETMMAAHRRAGRVLGWLARHHRGQSVAVVAPKLLRALLCCRIAGLGPESVWQHYREGAAWEVLAIPDRIAGRA